MVIGRIELGRNEQAGQVGEEKVPVFGMLRGAIRETLLPDEDSGVWVPAFTGMALTQATKWDDYLFGMEYLDKSPSSSPAPCSAGIPTRLMHAWGHATLSASTTWPSSTSTNSRAHSRCAVRTIRRMYHRGGAPSFTLDPPLLLFLCLDLSFSSK